MSTTFLSTIPHVLVKKGKGKYHAAIEGPEKAFRTACGELLDRASQYPAEQLAGIVAGEPGAICKRCDRVGLAIDRN